MNIFLISGNLIIKSKKIRFWNIAAYFFYPIPQSIEYKVTEINGDYTIDDDTSTSFFSCYYAKGEVIAYENNYELIPQSPSIIYKDFKEEMTNLEKLLSIDLEFELGCILNRQIYIGVISALELFLSEMLICWTFDSEENFEKYIECSSEVKKEKIEKDEDKEGHVYSQIQRINYHQIDKVEEKFKKLMGVTLSSNIESINEHIKKRHDLVHRNGKKKSTNLLIKISKEDILNEINELTQFTEDLLSQMDKKEWNRSFDYYIINNNNECSPVKTISPLLPYLR